MGVKSLAMQERVVNEYLVGQGEADGVKIVVAWDPHPENPRDWYDCRASLVCWDPRHGELGDRHAFAQPRDFITFAEQLGVKGIAYRPLYLLDHSGLWLSTTAFQAAPDSTQVGWAYMTREKYDEYFEDDGKDWREIALRIVEAEVAEYGSYLCGYVFDVEVSEGPSSGEPDCYTVFGQPGEDLRDAIKDELYESAYAAIDAIEWPN